MSLGGLFEDERRRGREPRQDLPVWEGIITSENINDPGDDLFVAPVTDADSPDGPARWAPRVEPGEEGRVAIRYPARGDRAAVTETDDGQIWVLEWWPYG